MPFAARIQSLPAPERHPRGSANQANSLTDLADRVSATTAAAAKAPQGVRSAAWRSFIQEHPAIQDPFARVVQSAPEIADAATRTFYDGLLKAAEGAGLQGQVKTITDALNNYYRYEDNQGNACAVDDRGRVVSPVGAPCALVKVAGGGLSVIQGLLKKQTGSQRAALERAINAGLREVTRGPQQIWSKLSNAWKTSILLAGLAASTPLTTGLRLSRGNIAFSIPGVGELQIDEGQLKRLAVSLPPVRLRGLTIQTSGKVTDTSGEGRVAVVVPVKKTSVRAAVEHQQEPGERTTAIEAGAQRAVGERGRVEAGTKTTWSSRTSRIPTEYTLAASTSSRSGKVSASAGVTGQATRTGQRVELASNPAVTVKASGQLPTLNRRLRRKQRSEESFKKAQDQARADKQAREREIVAELMKVDPKTDKARYEALTSELDQIRRDLGSANVATTPPESEVNGDVVLGALGLGVVAWLSRK